MKIGVLAVQGAFIEHENILTKAGATCVEIRQKSDLAGIDGIVLPGGESTVQGQLLRKLDLLEPIKERITDGLPTLGTCAGLILMASRIENDPQVHLGTFPVTVKRNAYGRQLSSFVTDAPLQHFGTFPMVFIRAPYIAQAAENVEILATVEDRIVAARYGNQIGLAFHPELSTDARIHEFFLSLC